MPSMKSMRIRDRIAFIAMIVLCINVRASPTTVFTYQGKLTDNGAPANATYDLQFTLWDAATGGIQQPQPGPITQTLTNVAASNGIFTVQLDFTVNAFPGADRFLEIGVRPAGGGSFTILGQRQQINASPYAIRTISAGTADALSSACVGCVLDAQINSVSGSKVSGPIPVASVPALSGNYIQNTVSTQAGANFNIAGGGTAGSLTINGPETFAGVGAPAVASAGQGRVYYDTAANKLKVSENGAAYVNLVGATGVSGSGTGNTIALWSAGTTLGNSVMTQSGSNIGIGTASPTGKLDVRGNLVLDPGSDPTVYTGTANSELNRYLQLINSPTAPTASGLKAGGVLVADSYGYANPGKNDLIVKGNAGIGTGSPQSRLHVLGSSNIAFPFLGLTVDQTVHVGDPTGYAMKVTTTSGGVTTTNLMIDSVGNVGIGNSSPVASLMVSGAGAFDADHAARFDLFNTTANTGYLQHVNDSGLWQLATSSGATRLAVNAAGNVGIGTATPTAAKLVVNDTSVGTGVAGVSSIGSGVFGQSTSASGWGVYGKNAAGGYAQYAEGNAGQSRDKGGWAKALVVLNSDATIAACYNALTGSSSGTCGFASSHPNLGYFVVDFGFQVTDRFIVATAVYDGGATAASIFSFPSTNSVGFYVKYIDDAKPMGANTNAPIHIVVF